MNSVHFAKFSGIYFFRHCQISHEVADAWSYDPHLLCDRKAGNPIKFFADAWSLPAFGSL